MTGCYFFDSNIEYQPPLELQNFLKEGNTPICVSFGSMVNRDAEKIDHIVRETLRQTNQRGIILSGWGRVNHSSSKDLLYLQSIPHDWLLPQCKILIHHGGAGTTSAGLGAGIPQVVVPFMADQPFWGRRVYGIGVGSKPILVKNLSTQRLVRAIADAELKEIRECAQAVGRKVRSEDGICRAVEVIESVNKRL